jgi:hypothetical protein
LVLCSCGSSPMEWFEENLDEEGAVLYLRLSSTIRVRNLSLFHSLV